MRTLDEVIAVLSPESQARIRDIADEMILETGLQMMRKELQPSQKNVAEAMDISSLLLHNWSSAETTLRLLRSSATLRRWEVN